MGYSGAGERIAKAVLDWDGTEVHAHRFGGSEFRVGKREIGHVHGDRLVDIPFPKKIREEIVGSGRADLHHVLPESGWVSLHLGSEADVQTAIQLLRRSYEIAMKQRSKPRTTGD